MTWPAAAALVKGFNYDALQNDVAAATTFVEGEVQRLLSGSCEAWELVMTARFQIPFCCSHFSCLHVGHA